MRKIVAIFKGQNGSMGFITGKPYLLTINPKSPNRVEDRAGNRACEYASVLKFLQNWENIKDVTD